LMTVKNTVIWLCHVRFGGCHVDDCEEYCHLVMSCEIWRLSCWWLWRILSSGYVMYVRFGGCHVDDCEEYCHLVTSCEIWRLSCWWLWRILSSSYVMWDLEAVMLMTVKNTVIWLCHVRFGGYHVDDCEEYCHLVMSCEIWRLSCWWLWRILSSSYVMWNLEAVMLMTVKNTVIFLLPDKDITYFSHTLNMLFFHIFTFGLFLRFCRLVWSDSCDFKI